MQRLTGEHFEAIQNIKARQKAFLDYIAGFYNSNNRGTDAFGTCVYRASGTSPGCAIGQFLSPDLADRCAGSITTVFNNEKHYADVPAWMKEMGLQFLIHVQVLHDRSKHWDEKGLTALGRMAYQEITVDFCLI